MHLADNWLNLRRLEASVPTFATDLDALLRQTGFEPDGLMKLTLQYEGSFYDECSYARLRDLDARRQLKRSALPLAKRSITGGESSKLMIRHMESRDIVSPQSPRQAPKSMHARVHSAHPGESAMHRS